jgi:type I restriction enzyme R subunit
VVCFRNLKKATDEAITLFSNKEAKEVILLEPYEEYVKKFNKAVEDLLKVAPTIRSVDELPSETEELEFIKAFRELMRLKNALTPFSDFSFDDLAMSEQRFEDYKSKYLDLYEKVKHNKLKEKVSILDDVDFELELIHRDEINVAYILKLLAKIKDGDEKEKKNYQKKVSDFLSGEAQLRSKRKLIEKFIQENLPKLGKKDDVEAEFQKYWNEEQQKAFEDICKQENIKPEKLKPAIEKYLFTERKPLRDEVVEMLEEKPKLLKRKTIVERVIEKIVSFVDTFINGMGED